MNLISRLQQASPFYSLEFFPPAEREQWPAFFGVVERLKALKPQFASVTYGAGGGKRDNTLGIVKGLVERGVTPLSHLTCVNASRESLRDYLQALDQCGVTNVLALRGDPPQGTTVDWNACEFPRACDLVEFIREEFPDFGLGVAAYLTPHPESLSFEQDRLATRDKLDKGSDFAITQLFFDPREYFEFIAQMRAIGVTKPIIPGVLPVQSLESLRRVLSLSGCNIPAKLYLSLEEAHEKGGSEAVSEAGTRYAVDQIRRLLDGGAPGIHLYTLNRADTCLRIAEQVGPL